MKVAPALIAIMLSACAPSLAGQLTGPGGEAVTSPEARVNVSPLGGDDDVVALNVDASGHYATSETLKPGEYLVEALVPGYGMVSRRIRLADSTTVDLSLKPLSTTKASAMHVNSGLDEGRGAGGATLTPPSL